MYRQLLKKVKLFRLINPNGILLNIFCADSNTLSNIFLLGLDDIAQVHGRRIVKAVPFSSSESTDMDPLWASNIAFTITNPRPVP